MKKSNYALFFLFFVTVILPSCGKGYQVRFSNYYPEIMDSVIVGNNKIVFKNVARDSTTEFNSLKKGDYQILFISRSKKKFVSKLTIPKTGSGNRTIEIDGISQISILEE